MNLPLPIRILLWPLSWIYAVIVQYKRILYDKDILEKKRLKAVVISVVLLCWRTLFKTFALERGCCARTPDSPR